MLRAFQVSRCHFQYFWENKVKLCFKEKVTSLIVIMVDSFYLLRIYYHVNRNHLQMFKDFVIKIFFLKKVSETKNIRDDLNFNSENYQFFGISFNEIPFIDDSKYNSYADLSWNSNPYKQLINSNDA